MHVLTGAYTTAAVLVSLSLTLLGHKRKSSRRRPNKTGQQCTQHDQMGRFYAACSTGQFDGGNEGRAELWLTKRSQGESSHIQHGLRQLIQLQPIGHLSQVLYAVAQRDHHFDLVVCQRDSGAVTAVSTLFLAHTFPSSTGATSLVAFRSIG